MAMPRRIWLLPRLRDAITNRRPLTDAAKKKVVPFLRTVFGVPGSPQPTTHVCGWVAEFLWYRLTEELGDQPERKLRRLEGPGFHATEPGGDGLAVWERGRDGVLTFCLWEIKNHVGNSALTGTIGGAYKQLDGRATEYLAKLTSVAAAAEDGPEMGALYADLVNLWVDDSDRAGAGVAIGTHSRLAPQRCFTTMQRYFPGKQNPSQLEGLIAAVANFDTFAKDVQERIWIAF